MAPQRRSTRQAEERAAARKRSPYIDPDTEDDLEAQSEEEDDEPEPAAQPPRKRRKLYRRPKPQTRSRNKVAPKRNATNVLVGAPRKARKNDPDAKNTVKQFTGPSDGRAPPWTSLPIDILLSVFQYASQPLDNLDDVRWLLGAARTCKAFAQPALEAYYKSPAILTSLQPHHFLDLLRMYGRFMDYNVKVKRLIIDVEYLAYQAHGRGLFDLSALVARLPCLEHLEIMHPTDKPDYKDHRNLKGWNYPADLFDTLDLRGLRLKSWRWSRDMLPDTHDFTSLFPKMAAIHQHRSLEHLEHVAICGFDMHDSPSHVESSEDGVETKHDMPWAIAKLINLKDLTLISCDVVRGEFLEHLPTRLERLELSNCHNIDSDGLEAFLIKSGASLRELVLNHNSALDLAVLPTLRVNCSKLEVLKIDMQYYSELYVTNDAEPLYDELLADEEVPAWPTTLRHLELLHVRKCSKQGATNLFSSLVDSAPVMPNLRTLVLLAHLDIGYRDRVAMRDTWVERLRHVFLRRSSEPNPHYGSHRQIRLWKQAQTKLKRDSLFDGRDEFAKSGTDSDDEPLVRRRMSYVRVSPHKPTGDTEIGIDTSPIKRPARRSKRVAESQVSESATPAPESQSSESEPEAEKRKLHVQGLCDTVMVSIDNQRPRQLLYGEKDFLDSEASGDEDWHEGADENGDDRYAW